MYSEEAEKREEERKAREAEQEELALSLGDTKERVKKYDRLKKKTRTKVFLSRLRVHSMEYHTSHRA